MKMKYIMKRKEKKNVKKKEEMRMMEEIVNMGVKQWQIGDENYQKEEGDRYIVEEKESGEWEGKDGMVE